MSIDVFDTTDNNNSEDTKKGKLGYYCSVHLQMKHQYKGFLVPTIWTCY